MEQVLVKHILPSLDVHELVRLCKECVEIKDFDFLADFLLEAVRFMRRQGKGNGFGGYEIICEEVGMAAALNLLGVSGRDYSWLWEVLDDIRFPCMCHLGHGYWRAVMMRRDFTLLKGLIIGRCKYCCDIAYMHAVCGGCTYVFEELGRYMNPNVNVFFQIILAGNRVMLSKLYELMEKDEDARVEMISSVHRFMEQDLNIEFIDQMTFCEEVSIILYQHEKSKEARWILKQLRYLQKILWVMGFVKFVRDLNNRLAVERLRNQDELLLGLW